MFIWKPTPIEPGLDQVVLSLILLLSTDNISSRLYQKFIAYLIRYLGQNGKSVSYIYIYIYILSVFTSQIAIQMAVVRILKMYSFHNCRLFSCSYHFYILSYINDFILFVSLCTFIVNCVSLYQVSPAQTWVASWICELFRPPARWAHGLLWWHRTVIKILWSD